MAYAISNTHTVCKLIIRKFIIQQQFHMHFLQHHLLHFYHFVYHFVCLFTTSFFTTTCHLQPPFLRPLAIYNHLPFTTTCHLQPLAIYNLLFYDHLPFTTCFFMTTWYCKSNFISTNNSRTENDNIYCNLCKKI